jgi:hypothetical protein
MELLGLPLVALLLCGVILLGLLGFGLFILLVKIGVIVREAQRPPHIDAGDYRLSQGRDVGRDE